MISSENWIYQWIFVCFLCFFDKCVLVASIDPVEDVQFSRYKSYSRSWTHWSEWSQCSRTCGGGVRLRSRACRIRSNRYSSPGSACSGETTEHELCSPHSCPSHDKDILEYQCSKRSGHVVTGITIDDWVPYRYGTNPCELQCWSRERSILQSFGKATDGTSCPGLNSQKSALCVNGRCLPIDCAGKIGSHKKFDRCGICGGNNSTCIKIENTFWRRTRDRPPHGSNKNYHYDYEEIFTIPAGAANILIKEASRTNFLALADNKGNHFINSNWRVQSPGQVTVHNTAFTYNRTWDGIEELSSILPTKLPLKVLALGSGDIPTVHYEYWISSNSSSTIHQTASHADSNRKQSYHFKTFPPSSNSASSSSAGNKMTVSPKLRGYNSYYHRNEILKSVPSWSIKRHSTYKNPLNILSFQTQNNDGSVSNAAFYQRHFVPEDPDARVQQRKFKTNSDTSPLNKTSTNKPAAEVVQLNFSERSNRISARTAITGNVYEYDLFQKQTNTTEPKKRTRLKNENKELNSPNNRKVKNLRKQPTHNKRKRKSNNENCSPCTKARHQTKNFCLSEFVLRVVVLSSERQESNNRFEMEVVRSYKNKVPIMPREYIWSMDSCRCPKLKSGREYILMGYTKTFERESRLVVDKNSFIRKYTQNRAKRMLKLVRDQNSKCKKY